MTNLQQQKLTELKDKGYDLEPSDRPTFVFRVKFNGEQVGTANSITDAIGVMENHEQKQVQQI